MSALAAATFVACPDVLGAEQSTIDIGDIAKYPTDGIYDEFRARGFFVIRQGKRIVAQSAMCTHKKAKLTVSADGFACKAHGSKFSLDGKVLRSPAEEPLSRYAIRLDGNRLTVDLSRVFKTDKFHDAMAFVEIT